MTTTVRLVDVHKRYGSVRAVDGVTLDIGPEITGLLGPNGAGKTTLLRIVATALSADSGQVEVLGRATRRSDDLEAIRARLGYLPQEPGFHRSFSAFAFVDYVAILKGMVDRGARHDEVRRVLDATGLTSVMNKRIRTLSGGMRRRVAIAQSLLGDPDLLVLDEPTAGLDPEQRLRFRELLTSRAGERTVIISTHQTDDVAALCQRVIVQHEGKVHFDGTPQALTDLASERVWVASERDPRAALAFVTSEGEVRHVGDPPSGAALVAPTIADGYLLLVGASERKEAA